MKTILSSKLADKRLAVLGAGKIGGILLRAFLQQKLVQPKRVHATVRHAEKARSLARQLGIVASTDNRAAVHYAVRNYGDYPRLLERILISDEKLYADL